MAKSGNNNNMVILQKLFYETCKSSLCTSAFQIQGEWYTLSAGFKHVVQEKKVYNKSLPILLFSLIALISAILSKAFLNNLEKNYTCTFFICYFTKKKNKQLQDSVHFAY